VGIIGKGWRGASAAKGEPGMRNPNCKFTYYPTSAALLLSAVLGLYPTFAEAGPCSADIAQFELAIRQSAGNPNAGLTAPQSIAAQDEHQPTVASVKNAQRALKARFAATMAQAKRRDARNDEAGCQRALSEAKKMYLL
jgi:hypothetical protein